MSQKLNPSNRSYFDTINRICTIYWITNTRNQLLVTSVTYSRIDTEQEVWELFGQRHTLE